MAWKDGKYIADSKFGMVGDMGNWIGSQVSGSTAPANRSGHLNSMVTGNRSVTGSRNTVGQPSLATPAINPVQPVSLAQPSVNKGTSNMAPSTRAKGTGNRSSSALKAPISNASLPPLPAALPMASPEQTLAGYQGDVQGMMSGDAYTPGQFVTGTPSGVFGDPSQYASMNGAIPANPEGQYANMAGEGNVALTQPQGGMNWDMGDIAKGVEAASGLANAYLGYKNYGLAKDQFGFTKALANRNIANQASEYNTGLQNAGEVGMSLAGNTMDPAARAARQAQLDTQKISSAPIG